MVHGRKTEGQTPIGIYVLVPAYKKLLVSLVKQTGFLARLRSAMRLRLGSGPSAPGIFASLFISSVTRIWLDLGGQKCDGEAGPPERTEP